MFSHKRIMVLVDPAEDNEVALNKAAQLAKKLNSKVVLFSSGYSSSLAHNPGIDPEKAEQAREAFIHRIQLALEERTTGLVVQGLEVECVALWDKHPSEAIIRYLEENPADLVIKTTHHQNVIQRTFFSHTDWDLIRQCETPLLLTKSEPWSENMSMTAAVDPVNTNDKPPELDEHILNFSKRFAAELQAKLNVLHVYDPTPLLIYLDQPALDATEITDQIHKQHDNALTDLANKMDVDPEQVFLETGNPSSIIPDFLYENDSHMVVMGALHRHGLNRLLVGHTAEKILDRITADILVVKLSIAD